MRRQAVRCHGRKTDGSPCPNWAMAGQLVCSAHGGRSPQAKLAAQRRLAEGRAARTLADLGEPPPPVTDAVTALEALAGEAVALTAVLRRAVSELEQLRYSAVPGAGGEQLRGELQAYLSALGRAESICGRIASLGLDERRVRVEEAQMAALLSALNRALARAALEPAIEVRVRELAAAEINALDTKETA